MGILISRKRTSSGFKDGALGDPTNYIYIAFPIDARKTLFSIGVEFFQRQLNQVKLLLKSPKKVHPARQYML